LLTDVPPPDAKARFLNPRVLPPITKLNPDVSASVEAALDWALEMHPDERPSTITQFHQALTGKLSHPRNGSSSQPADTLNQAISANWPVILVSMGLFILAVALTIF
jgi:serine/threonine-protein kinase